MTISMYAASVPVFKKTLVALSAILAKTDAPVTAKKIEPSALLQARIFPDMLAFTRQVQLTCDFSKRAVARLAGIEAPSHEDTETSFVELQARIASTVAFIDTITPEQINGSEDRPLVVPAGPGKTLDFTGQNFLLHFALPNVYFHATTAYEILRHNGVEIGKRDFLGAE